MHSVHGTRVKQDGKTFDRSGLRDLQIPRILYQPPVVVNLRIPEQSTRVRQIWEMDVQSGRAWRGRKSRERVLHPRRQHPPAPSRKQGSRAAASHPAASSLSNPPEQMVSSDADAGEVKPRYEHSAAQLQAIEFAKGWCCTCDPSLFGPGLPGPS